MAAAVDAPVEAEFRADEEQSWIPRIFRHSLHWTAGGQIARDRAPSRAAIGRREQIGLRIIVGVSVESDVRHTRVEARGEHAAHRVGHR